MEDQFDLIHQIEYTHSRCIVWQDLDRMKNGLGDHALKLDLKILNEVLSPIPDGPMPLLCGSLKMLGFGNSN